MPTPYEYKELTDQQTMDTAPFNTLGVYVDGAGTVEGTIDGSNWTAVTIVNSAVNPNPWRLVRLNGAGTAHIIGKE